MKNMMEDVCELGSILQSGDEEKIALERKLVELDGAVQSQDRRLNHEVEAEHWARNEQIKILENAENASDNFELSSSVISQLQEEATSTRHLHNIIVRVENYVKLKEDLVSSVKHTQLDIKRLQEALGNLEEIKANEIQEKNENVHKLIIENETLEENLGKSLTETQTCISTKIEETLLLGASNISSTFSQIDQSRRLVDDKTKDLLRKALAERSEADLTLLLLQSAKQVSSSHVKEVLQERDDIVGQVNGTVDGILQDESLLHISQEENKALLNNSTSSSKAKHTTAQEVDNAKKGLIELEKESSDNIDELDRIRKALSFEKLREEAFVKSQNGNAGSAQQICLETDNLKQSLDIVREKIVLIKHQITPQLPGNIVPWAQMPQLLTGVPHEELHNLSAANQCHLNQQDTISANVAFCTQEKDMLNEKLQVADIHTAAAREEKANLQKTEEVLLAKQKELMEKIQVISTAIQASLPYIDSASSDSISPEIISQLQQNLQEVESERETAVGDSISLIASTASHAEKVKTFNVQKESQYELADKNQRLKTSQQKKLIDTERMLKEIQKELTIEDGKFQEAVKVAEEGAKKKEEELLAIMNDVSSVGLEIISSRNNTKKEVKELEDSLELMTQENDEQLLLLTSSSIDAAKLPSTETSQRNVPSHLRWARNQADAPLAKTINTKTLRLTSVEASLEGQGEEKEIACSPHSSWATSSPATHLPEQLAGLEDEALPLDAATTMIMQPSITGSMVQSKRIMERQRQDGVSKKATLVKKKSLGTVTATTKLPLNNMEDKEESKSSATHQMSKTPQPATKIRAGSSAIAVDREKGVPKATTGNERHRRSH